MKKKKVIYTLILGLATTFVAPTLTAYATESYEISTASVENGWDYDGTDWYFYENGQKKIGWYYEKEKDTWYYLNNSGAMVTDWKKIDGKWFYFNPNSDGTRGAMKTGWLKDGGYWYYLNPKSDGTRGAMLTGWITVEGKSYYLNPNEGGPQGSMLANTYTPDGYYVDSNGVWDGKYPASNTGQAIVNEAKKHLGKAYVWGATGPNNFDCSGLTQYVYKQVTGRDISRTTYTQINQGTAVSRSNLQLGDLVFTSAGHVGIYVGNGQIIHAPQTGDVVKISNIWSFHAARRIL